MISAYRQFTLASADKYRFEDEPITVVVGTEKVSFMTYKQLICNASPFFQKALKGKFKEATIQQVELPDVDPEMFSQYLQWMYSGTIDVGIFLLADKKVDAADFWPAVRKLYTLGSYLQCPAFGNMIIKCIRRKLGADGNIPLPTSLHISEIDSSTVGGCALRRLVVLMHVAGPHMKNRWDKRAWDKYAWDKTNEARKTWIADMPEGFVKDFAVTLLDNREPDSSSGWYALDEDDGLCDQRFCVGTTIKG
jgi:BTB/POZ domain